MPDKKDVAQKIKKHLDRMHKVVDGLDRETARKMKPEAVRKFLHDRLACGVETFEINKPGLAALSALFDRQLRAQLNVHKLSKDVVCHPPKKGKPVAWDSEWMKHMTMWLDAMIDEIQEVRGWLNWKSWKKPCEISESDVVNARLELIDLFHFWVNAYLMLGGSPESMIAEYHAKRNENDDRQKKGY